MQSCAVGRYLHALPRSILKHKIEHTARHIRPHQGVMNELLRFKQSYLSQALRQSCCEQGLLHFVQLLIVNEPETDTGSGGVRVTLTAGHRINTLRLCRLHSRLLCTRPTCAASGTQFKQAKHVCHLICAPGCIAGVATCSPPFASRGTPLRRTTYAGCQACHSHNPLQ